jgi:hypothetical protein
MKYSSFSRNLQDCLIGKRTSTSQQEMFFMTSKRYTKLPFRIFSDGIVTNSLLQDIDNI